DARLRAGPRAFDNRVPKITRPHGAIMQHPPPTGLPLFEVAIPHGIVIWLRRIRKNQIPIRIGFDRIHQAVTHTHADVGIGNLPSLALAVNEIEDVRMCVVEYQHKSTSPGPTLLNQAGDEAVQRTPRYRPARPPIHPFDIGAAWTQGGDIDSHTAAA